MKKDYINTIFNNNINKSSSKLKNKYNFGVGFLRVISSLMVVMNHCFNIKTTFDPRVKFFYIHVRYAVPIFFLLTFYYMTNSLASINKPKLIKRIERLIIPYLIWPVIILVLNKFLYLKTNINLPHSFKHLKLQILYSWHYLFPLWFIYVLILYILLFIIVILIFKKHHLFILCILTILSYIVQYSRIILLKNKNKLTMPNAVKIPEHFQHAFLGFIISSFKIMSYLEKHRFKTITLSLLLLRLLNNYNLFNPTEGHMYSNLKFFFGTPPIFFIFALFPLNYIARNNVLFAITKETTNYTMGVYTLHISIFSYILKNTINYRFLSIKKRNFQGSLTIYFLCYAISFLLNKILKKTKLKNMYL